MVTWKTYFIVFAPIIGISLIFRYLVNTKKIKPNKVSKFFYYDDESFIKSWKKTQEKGFLRYALKNIILFATIMFIIRLFFLLNKRSMFEYEQSQLFGTLSMGIILGLVESIVGWIHDQVRNSRLKEKGIVEKEYS